MKMAGIIFGMVAVIVLIMAAIIAFQLQMDAGDAVIDNTSENYGMYQQMKVTTVTSSGFMAYLPYVFLILLLLGMGAMFIAGIYAISKYG